MDLELIHRGLADAAGAVAGLRAYPSLPGSIVPPVFAPTEFEMDYHGTFGATRGMTTATFTCGIFAPSSEAGRQILLPFLNPAGDTSVPAALEADKTLGGACKTLVVTRVRGAYRLYEVGNTDYLGAMIEVKVYA